MAVSFPEASGVSSLEALAVSVLVPFVDEVGVEVSFLAVRVVSWKIVVEARIVAVVEAAVLLGLLAAVAVPFSKKLSK